MYKIAKLYYVGMITEKYLNDHSTNKAFYSSYDDGRWKNDRNDRVWFPKSICKFGEPNDVGWVKVCIPLWFFQKNNIEYQRCVDIQWNGVKEI